MMENGTGRPWARAWIDALSDYADPARWRRGVQYYENDFVLRVTMVPGRIVGKVQGSREQDYDVVIVIPMVKDAPLLRVIHFLLGDEDAMTEVLEHVPQLIPDVSRLEFMCTCPDWGEPCKHAVAVWLEAANEIVNAPGRLLRLRGLSNDGPVAERRPETKGTHQRTSGRLGKVIELPTRSDHGGNVPVRGAGRRGQVISFPQDRASDTGEPTDAEHVDAKAFWEGDAAAFEQLLHSGERDDDPGPPEWVFTPPVTWSSRGPSYTQLMERIYDNIARGKPTQE